MMRKKPPAKVRRSTIVANKKSQLLTSCNVGIKAIVRLQFSAAIHTSCKGAHHFRHIDFFIPINSHTQSSRLSGGRIRLKYSNSIIIQIILVQIVSEK